MPLVGVGLDRSDHQIGIDPVGDEGLRPIDDVDVAIANGRCLDPGQIRACAGLGHGNGGHEIPRHHTGHPPRGLLTVAQVGEIGKTDIVVEGDAHPRGHGIGAHQLLADHHVEAEVRYPSPAVLLRQRHAEEPGLSRLAKHVLVDLPLRLPFGDVGSNLPLDELTDGGAEQLMVRFEQVSFHIVPGAGSQTPT